MPHLVNEDNLLSVSFDATGTDHTLVAAPGAGKRLLIYAIHSATASSTTVVFEDNDTALTGAMTGTAHVMDLWTHGDGRIVPRFTLSFNNGFEATTGASVQFGGVVWYTVDDGTSPYA